jgi:hypothetical protein
VLKALLKYAPKSVEMAEATYADGNVIIPQKFEDGGNMKLALDIKQLAAPDTEMQEMMNKINGSQKPEKETVPAGKNGESAQKAEVAPASPPSPQGRTAAAPQGGNTQRTGSKGALFPEDEAEDLDGIEPPDFGN